MRFSGTVNLRMAERVAMTVIGVEDPQITTDAFVREIHETDRDDRRLALDVKSVTFQ